MGIRVARYALIGVYSAHPQGLLFLDMINYAGRHPGNSVNQSCVYLFTSLLNYTGHLRKLFFSRFFPLKAIIRNENQFLRSPLLSLSGLWRFVNSSFLNRQCPWFNDPYDEY